MSDTPPPGKPEHVDPRAASSPDGPQPASADGSQPASADGSDARDAEHRLPAGIGLTALAVADARAREHDRPDPLFDDPFAHLFVDAAGADFAPPSTQGGLDIRAMRADYVSVRTRYFDDAVLAATADGCTQVVILAAGLDTRAFRVPWPPGTRVFELDVADVLAFKEPVLAAAGARPTCLERHAIVADLRDDWTMPLRAAGFNPGIPTAWLAEGILMYLPEADRDTLLDRLTACSAAGSHLALEPAAWLDSANLGESLARGVMDAGAMQRLASRLRRPEPATAADASVADPAAWLARHGWNADVVDVSRKFVEYGRAVPGLFGAVSNAGLRRLASAVRAAPTSRGCRFALCQCHARTGCVVSVSKRPTRWGRNPTETHRHDR